MSGFVNVLIVLGKIILGLIALVFLVGGGLCAMIIGNEGSRGMTEMMPILLIVILSGGILWWLLSGLFRRKSPEEIEAAIEQLDIPPDAEK